MIVNGGASHEPIEAMPSLNSVATSRRRQLCSWVVIIVPAFFLLHSPKRSRVLYTYPGGHHDLSNHVYNMLQTRLSRSQYWETMVCTSLARLYNYCVDHAIEGRGGCGGCGGCGGRLLI